MPTVLTAMRTGTDDDSLEQYLARSAIFRGIGPDKLRVFAEASELRAYNVLDEAVIEGVTPSSLSIVISGRFVVLLPGKRLARFGDSAMVNLDCYLPGDSFGETALSLHECTSPPASIVATEVSRVFSI
ncbi:MAG: hypothetical protein OEQ74_10055, partial [Gammaproteobacteria bacterium]|nr:hypothetical protein [Gammaproteobacteria bacterium]